MTQWRNTVRKILGYFWINVFKDSWLIQSIYKFFQSVIGKALATRIKSIQVQLSVSNSPAQDYLFPVCVLVDASVQSNTISLAEMSMGQDQIGTQQNGYVYKARDLDFVPDYIQDKVDSPNIKLAKDVDYVVQNSSIVFNKSLVQLGFVSSIVTVNGQIRQCFKLWCMYDNHSTVLDKFSGVLGLPTSWAYKYPGSIQTAWSIKINGSSKRDVLRLLALIGGCKHISSDINSQDAQSFISATSDAQDIPVVYTSKDGIPQSITEIPVITDCGVLYAQNSQAAVTDNILPMSGDGYEKYVQLCGMLNQDQQVPHTQLPATLNPAQYIFKNIWRHSGFILVTPSTNYQDMCIAVDFILSNVTLGAIPIVYRHIKSVKQVFRPDIAHTTEILKYYQQSVNNGLQEE